MDVAVLIYSHRHGEDVSVHASMALATKALADIARESWGEAVEYNSSIGETPPANEEELIDVYFETMMDTEGYVVETQTIQGALIGILFTVEDAISINEDIESPVSNDLAKSRAEEQAGAIEKTATDLIGEQLTSVIERDSP